MPARSDYKGAPAEGQDVVIVGSPVEMPAPGKARPRTFSEAAGEVVTDLRFR
jgi:hypothetical protein